jgi:toxin ParE1/3/4
MKRKVILDPEADRDIEDEFNYLADRSIDAALRFLKATEETFDDLAEMPGMGSPRRFKNSKLAGVRMWPIKDFPNYLAFYLTTDESIRVLRVLHGARNIERILDSDAGA